jgi:hypothetical protein
MTGVMLGADMVSMSVDHSMYLIIDNDLEHHKPQ